MYVDTTNDYLAVLHYSTLSRDTTTDYPLCSALSVDSKSDYPIYRLSTVICMPILQTTISCAPLYSVSRYYKRLSALLYSLLYLSILQATIRFLCLAMLHPLSICRDYCSTPSYLLARVTSSLARASLPESYELAID